MKLWFENTTSTDEVHCDKFRHIRFHVCVVGNKIGPIYDIERRFYNTIAYRLSTKPEQLY